MFAPGGHYSEVGLPVLTSGVVLPVRREFLRQAALRCVKEPFGSGTDLLDRHKE